MTYEDVPILSTFLGACVANGARHFWGRSGRPVSPLVPGTFGDTDGDVLVLSLGPEPEAGDKIKYLLTLNELRRYFCYLLCTI